MSFPNAKSFILILLVAATHSRSLNKGMGGMMGGGMGGMGMGMGSSGGYGSGSGSSGSYGNQGNSGSSGNVGGGFMGPLIGYRGPEDIGLSVADLQGDIGVGAGDMGVGGFGDVGFENIGNVNLWGEMQAIVDSVGGLGAQNNIANIGLTESDFNFVGNGAHSGSGSYGRGSGSSGSYNMNQNQNSNYGK